MNILIGRFGSRNVALGIAFGVLLGLLPKANLLFVVFAVLFFLSSANLLIGIGTLIMCSIISPLFVYPWAESIGTVILTSAPGQKIGATLFQIPLVPWTMLDNTVVLGTFLIGIILFLPICHTVRFAWRIRSQQ